jgi:hypothetical protein
VSDFNATGELIDKKQIEMNRINEYGVLDER